MPEYLATGRDPSGKKVTERIDADSADEAMQILRDRGYDEIVLHTDDVGARYTNQSAVASVITPRQYLWPRHMPRRLAGFLLVTIKIYQQGWITYLAALALLAYRYWQGSRWAPLDVVLVIFLVSPPIFALAAQFLPSPGGRYRRLIDAVAWGRWDEVLAQADSVGGGIPPEEAAFRKAQALAGLDRLDEALPMVKPFGDGVSMPLWLYWSRLATVYSTAKRYEASRAAMEKALDLDPDNATLLVDKAESEVWLRRNPRLARELLARAREHALGDVVREFAIGTEGLIRLEEGHAGEARELLEEAFEKLRAYQHASPLIGAQLDKLHAAIALACAAQGDIEAAQRHYQLARPRLLALKHDDVIVRCEKAIGLPLDG